MSQATPQDVYDRMPPDMEHPPEAYVQTLLDDAERTLLATCAGLLNRTKLPATDPNYVDPELLVQVEALMVLRLLAAPDGYASADVVQETDGNYSYKLGDSGSGNQLSPTDDELALLKCGGNKLGLIALQPGPPAGWPPWYMHAEPYVHPDEVTPDQAFQLYSLAGPGGDPIAPEDVQ